MPNWSTNRFVVFGDKKQLQKFYADMQDAIAEKPTKFKPVANSWGNMWVGNLFLAAGYSEDEITGENSIIDCRGGVEGISYDSVKHTVIIDDYTAWEPNVRSMNKMLDKKYPGLYCVYRAELEGCEDRYFNSDTARELIPDDYAIDCWSDDGRFDDVREYYENEEDVLWAISDITGVSFDKIKDFVGSRNVEDINWEHWIRRVLELPEDFDCYFEVKKFLDDYE